jgi:hypothetical protein
MGKDRKAEKDIGVHCTWYKYDGQSRFTKTIFSTGTKLTDIAHAFHPLNS